MPGKIWSKEEIQFLKDNYKKLNHKELSLALKRSRESIAKMCSKLGLSLIKKRIHLYRDISIGERFSRLVVIEKIEERINGFIYYKCKCDCGNTKTAKGRDLCNSDTQSCGCLRKDRAKENNRLNIGEASFRALESSYKTGAKNKKDGLVSYKLSTSQFRGIIIQNCFWCKKEPKPTNAYYTVTGERNNRNPQVTKEWADQQWIALNGIDRVDNEVGYVLSNCVPCCSDCNFAKRAMDLYEWLSFIERFQPGFTQTMLEKLEKAGIKMPFK